MAKVHRSVSVFDTETGLEYDFYWVTRSSAVQAAFAAKHPRKPVPETKSDQFKFRCGEFSTLKDPNRLIDLKEKQCVRSPWGD
jgi:hypothetical protein